MDCAFYRERVSARLDGELRGLEASALDRHLLRCASCRSWTEAATALHELTRSARPAGVVAVPDMTESILASVTAAPDGTVAGRPRWAPRATTDAAARRRPASCGSAARALARLGLLLFAVAEAALALPWLSGGGSPLSPAPASQLGGGWGLGLAGGLLVVACRPRLVRCLLPVAAALAVALVASAGVRVSQGAATAATEVPHLVAVLGVALLCSLWSAERSVTASAEADPADGRAGLPRKGTSRPRRPA